MRKAEAFAYFKKDKRKKSVLNKKLFLPKFGSCIKDDPGALSVTLELPISLPNRFKPASAG